MKKPTEEQIDRAETLLNGFGLTNRALRQRIAEAAPFLQMPWEPPTKEETERIRDLRITVLSERGNTTGTEDERDAIADFVERRNADLLPKPVDPRLEKIRGLCKEWLSNTRDHSGEQLTEDILAALVEVKI